MTSIKPPKGWTIDPEEIDYENEWAPQNSDGQCMAIEFGLKDPRPIMVTTPDTGSPFVLFQSGNKFYQWNQVENSVWEIVKPQDLDAILEVMTENGERALKMKECQPRADQPTIHS
ncbi:hypothetical protein DTO169E5_8994 [Paecilomyces variotii]|nr:hypothetical protein DTO169E5_8994 [Paecilomyces variotii]